jgi:hypothetical protein
MRTPIEVELLEDILTSVLARGHPTARYPVHAQPVKDDRRADVARKRPSLKAALDMR